MAASQAVVGILARFKAWNLAGKWARPFFGDQKWKIPVDLLHRNSTSLKNFSKSGRLFLKGINTLASKRGVNPWALRAQPPLHTSSRYYVLSLTCWVGGWYLSKVSIRLAKEGYDFGAFRAVPMTLQHGPWRGHKPKISGKKWCLT